MNTPQPLKIPILETDRLRLRAHGEKDFKACASMWSDPVVVKFIGGKPSTPQQAWVRLLNYVGHWSLMGFGYWAVEEKSTGLFVGELGFADFKREISPSISGIPELGWALTPKFHGKGYATEALGAAITWGEKNFSGPRTVCIINPENKVSIRVAEKCGFIEVQHTTVAGGPTILFERFK